jgi:hypothetical protein
MKNLYQMIINGDIQHFDLIAEQFADTAGAACEFELRIRLFANNHNMKFDGKLSSIKDEILKKYKTSISVSDKEILNNCVHLRNKLFHVELSKVTGKLKTISSLKGQITPGVVSVLKLHFDNPDQNNTYKVADKNINDGSLYGWCVESHYSGAFKAVHTIFIEGIEVVNKLRDTTQNNGGL